MSTRCWAEYLHKTLNRGARQPLQTLPIIIMSVRRLKHARIDWTTYIWRNS